MKIFAGSPGVKTRALIALLSMFLLALAACGGGLDDASKTATAAAPTIAAGATEQAQSAATLEAQGAIATAEAAADVAAQAQAAATAQALAEAAARAQEEGLDELFGAFPAGEIYDDLSGQVRAMLDASGVDRATFERVLASLTGVGEPDFEGAALLFCALGDMPVDFLPPQFWGQMALLPAQVYQLAGVELDPEDLSDFAGGLAFPTGEKAAQMMRALGQFALMDQAQEEDHVEEPSPEEIKSFFASLPDDVKDQLEAAGWPEERINRLAESVEEPDPSELKSLLTPLANIPIPFLQEDMSAFLSQSPDFLLAPIIEKIGQQAFEELKSSARPPTGSEFLALVEVFETLGALGE